MQLLEDESSTDLCVCIVMGILNYYICLCMEMVNVLLSAMVSVLFGIT